MHVDQLLHRIVYPPQLKDPNSRLWVVAASFGYLAALFLFDYETPDSVRIDPLYILPLVWTSRLSRPTGIVFLILMTAATVVAQDADVLPIEWFTIFLRAFVGLCVVLVISKPRVATVEIFLTEEDWKRVNRRCKASETPVEDYVAQALIGPVLTR